MSTDAAVMQLDGVDARPAEGEFDVADFLLKIAASADWIGPVGAVVQDMVRGPHAVFMVDYDCCPLSGREIMWLLSKKGVEAWGFVVVWDTLCFSVAEKHERWAGRVLGNAGVPIMGVG